MASVSQFAGRAREVQSYFSNGKERCVQGSIGNALAGGSEGVAVLAAEAEAALATRTALGGARLTAGSGRIQTVKRDEQPRRTHLHARALVAPVELKTNQLFV